MARKLQRFEPVGLEEGRAFWRKYRGNPDIERVLPELAHGHQVFDELEMYFGRYGKSGKPRSSDSCSRSRKSCWC
ncbi:hypothetical protein AWB81_07761 [Caballeronia arationis]|jgi:hypothetical protein|uniref:Uncharacterized protein n=1 Tax=Caballeronia arationis TaxID=1777142 RepID=A0A7Z7IEU0_9BURK|nr:hypothetical protein AWB81_07761 [Caballeronia arationis]SOE91195.1 hypothetical protein SAMN05446927_8076 [Caballeronia arationis]